MAGWRKEGATDLKPLSKQGGGEEEAEEVWGLQVIVTLRGTPPERELLGS